MRGHVYKRGKSWAVVYDEPAENERRKQRSKGGFKTRREAETFLREQLARLDTGSYAAPAKTTVGEFLTSEWLPAVKPTLRPSSHDRYSRVVRLYIEPHIGGVKLQTLSAGHITGMHGKLGEQGLSVSTRRLVHAVIGRALRDAERWGRVPRNVARLAEPPAHGGSRVQAWTASELRRFLEHVEGDRLAALWRVAATTGMRRGELAAVTWQALDLYAGRLRVERQLVPAPGGAVFGPPKSRRSLRTVALDDRTVELLRAHRAPQLLERDFAGGAYTDGDLVFCDQLGRPIPPQRLTEWFAKHRAAAGIPVGSLHVLRHTAATLSLSSGVPVHIVAARLGDRPETILNVYAHLLPQSDELAAARIRGGAR
jgi:integrase